LLVAGGVRKKSRAMSCCQWLVPWRERTARKQGGLRLVAQEVWLDSLADPTTIAYQTTGPVRVCRLLYGGLQVYKQRPLQPYPLERQIFPAAEAGFQIDTDSGSNDPVYERTLGTTALALSADGTVLAKWVDQWDASKSTVGRLPSTKRTAADRGALLIYRLGNDASSTVLTHSFFAQGGSGRAVPPLALFRDGQGVALQRGGDAILVSLPPGGKLDLPPTAQFVGETLVAVGQTATHRVLVTVVTLLQDQPYVIRLLDTATGAETARTTVPRTEFHGEASETLDVSPDGQYLALLMGEQVHIFAVTASPGVLRQEADLHTWSGADGVSASVRLGTLSVGTLRVPVCCVQQPGQQALVFARLPRADTSATWQSVPLAWAAVSNNYEAAGFPQFADGRLLLYQSQPKSMVVLRLEKVEGGALHSTACPPRASVVAPGRDVQRRLRLTAREWWVDGPNDNQNTAYPRHGWTRIDHGGYRSLDVYVTAPSPFPLEAQLNNSGGRYNVSNDTGSRDDAYEAEIGNDSEVVLSDDGGVCARWMPQLDIHRSTVGLAPRTTRHASDRGALLVYQVTRDHLQLTHSFFATGDSVVPRGGPSMRLFPGGRAVALRSSTGTLVLALPSAPTLDLAPTVTFPDEQLAGVGEASEWLVLLTTPGPADAADRYILRLLDRVSCACLHKTTLARTDVDRVQFDVAVSEDGRSVALHRRDRVHLFHIRLRPKFHLWEAAVVPTWKAGAEVVTSLVMGYLVRGSTEWEACCAVSPLHAAPKVWARRRGRDVSWQCVDVDFAMTAAPPLDPQFPPMFVNNQLAVTQHAMDVPLQMTVLALDE
jgi:hypothetical protein